LGARVVILHGNKSTWTVSRSGCNKSAVVL